MDVNDPQENYRTGFISVYRSIRNHWIFKSDKHFKWWIIMLMEVNHQSNKMALGYKLYDIQKGQSSNSLRTWANLFNTGTKQVSNFFDLLESDKMITRKTIGKGKHSTTLITIENYSNYQYSKETQETTQKTTQGKRNGNAKETQGKRNRHTNNNDNNEDNVNNDNKDIHPLQKFIYDELPNVKKIGNISFDECEKLLSNYSKIEIKETLEALDNYKSAPKKYTSIYRTVNNWIKKNKEKEKSSAKKEVELN